MREIRFVRRADWTTEKELIRIDRIDRGDSGTYVEWIYWDFEGPMDERHEIWNWQQPGRWFAMFDLPADECWGYIFKFSDGTRGICQVKSVNQALAAVGCEVDRRGDETD